MTALTTSTNPQATADDFRAALTELGFVPREVPDGDLARRQFELAHPAAPNVKLVAFINVVSPWRQAEYHSAALYTLVNEHPLNVPKHPLNISIGLSEVHDAGLYAAIVRAAAERFAQLEVDEAALRW